MHKAPTVNERDRFDHLVRQDGLKRFRRNFDAAAGNPVWLLIPKSGSPARNLDTAFKVSATVWEDGRLASLRRMSVLFPLMRRAWRSERPFGLRAGKKRLQVFPVLPLGGGKPYAVLVLVGTAGLPESSQAIFLETLHLLSEAACRAEELTRLSATIKPRAIALSTVHTVHRIINSTLNLNELVSRLTHLAAQVLRVHRCLIYMVDKIPASAHSASARSNLKTRLELKAAIGYPKHRQPPPLLAIGRGLEGRIARSAQTLVRKSFISLPMIDEDVVGVVTISRKKDGTPFNMFDLEILNTLAEEAVIAIKNAQMYEEQRRVTLSTIQSIAAILGTRMPQNSLIPAETFLQIVMRVSEELRLTDEEAQALHYATLLKDTAKIGIPEDILRKTSKLTGEELHQIRSHPIQGARLVQSFESLKNVAPIILYSREKFDGTGYPEGLKGEQIPMGARILSVLNAFEAITVGRPYRGQSSMDEALDELSRNKGTQFDPRVVEAFVRVVRKDGISFPSAPRSST